MGGRKRRDSSIEDWTSELAKSHFVLGKRPPGEGWKTMVELKNELGIGKEKLREWMQVLREQKKLETFTGSDWSETAQVLCRQVWYRLK